MGASGSLRFPGNIHNSEAAYSPPLLYLSYESLPRSILFKLTDHSNKFSLFSRHYKYNLEREYSRSRILLIAPFSRPLRSPPRRRKSLEENLEGLLSLSRSCRARFRSIGISILRTDSRFAPISFPSIFPEKCIFQSHFLSTWPAY